MLQKNNYGNEKNLLLQKISKKNIKDLLTNNTNTNKKKYISKNLKISYPNVSRNKLSNFNSNNSIKESSYNSDNYNNYNSYKIKSYLNKSVSFPYLTKKDSNNNNNRFRYSKNLLNYTNGYASKSSLYHSMNDYDSDKANNTSKQNNKNNLLSSKTFDYNKGYKTCSNKFNHPHDNDITNSKNKNNDNKNKSLFQIINTKKIKPSQSCRNLSRNQNIFRFDGSSIIVIPNHTKYFKKSQKDNITAKRVFKHYLRKNKQDIIIHPIVNYNKFFNKKMDFLSKLSRLYCEDRNHLTIIKDLKDNKKLAYKKDFNIEKYQSTIVELMNQRVSQKNLFDLEHKNHALNKIIFNVVEPKGRLTQLAEQLRYNVPVFLLEKLKKLEKEKIINRMNYYKKFKSFQINRKNNMKESTKNKNNNDNNTETKNTINDYFKKYKI